MKSFHVGSHLVRVSLRELLWDMNFRVAQVVRYHFENEFCLPRISF